MARKSKKMLIILVPIIILIICIILLVIYLTTDFLKSNETLFLKYMSQNIDAVKMIIDNTTEKEYTNLLKQNKYVSTSEISASYTENINTSQENTKNDINKLKITTNTQSEYMNDYIYKNIKLLYNDADLFTTEYIHNQDNYGIRFPQEFNQFLAVKNENLNQIATDAGLTEEQIGLIPNSIEELSINSIFTFTDEEIDKLQEKYINIISENISKDKYSKRKDALITVGQNGIYTNSYSITLTQEQANDIYIKILEELKNDEIIINKISEIEPISTLFNYARNSQETLSNTYLQNLYVQKIEEKIQEIEQNNIGTSTVEYTVYESNGDTIRTQIVEETKQTTIDLNMTEGEIQVDIENEIANQEQEEKKSLQIIKKSNNEGSTFKIQNENIQGDEISKIEIDRNLNINSLNPTDEITINYNDGKDNELELKYNKDVKLNQEFNREIEINKVNTVILNDHDEQVISSCVNKVKDYITRVLQENEALITNVRKVNIIEWLFGKQQEKIVPNEDKNQITEIDKNRFNSKFEFYTGKEKTTEDVKKLLDEAKTCLKGAQVSYSNEGNTNSEKKLSDVKLTVENGVKNVELAENIKAMLIENKKYTVTIEKNASDLVTTILISVNK